MAMPFRPYGNPPAFDLEEYKDAFEAWEAQWKLFLRLSNIDIGVEVSARPSYKANIIKSCLSRHTLTALKRSGLTEAQLDDPDAITEYLRARANAGRNCHVWRQRFGNRVQRPNEVLDDWLCDLRNVARKCEFFADCCTKCETANILAQVIRGVNKDAQQCILFELGDALTLDTAIALLQNSENASLQTSNMKIEEPAFIQATRKSQYKKEKEVKQGKRQTTDKSRCMFCGGNRHPRTD